MVRARNIKPGFFKNELLCGLEPLTRLLFIGLWCMADREGRLEDRPLKIKIEVLPCDNCDIDNMLSDLEVQEFITRYAVDGKRYIQILKFKKHQTPHVREAASDIPEPCDNSENTSLAQCEHDTSTSLAQCEALPRSPDSLIPDSLIPDSLKKEGDLKVPCRAVPDGDPEILPVSSNGVPYEEIINYLNLKTGKAFEHTSKATQKHIHARWVEGRNLDDFKRVIDIKTADWLHDAKMVQFLRPKTLFGTNFEGYLNATGTKKLEERYAGITHTLEN